MGDQTVFIIGAGASTEFGKGAFPVGIQLATRIEEMLNAEYVAAPDDFYDSDVRPGPIVKELIRTQQYGSGIKDAINRVRHSIVDHESVDDLLNDWADRPAMALVAKMAIARIILEAENESLLAQANLDPDTATQGALSSLRDSWLGKLLRRLKSNSIDRRHVHEAFSGIAFIVFNYDRAIEHFLFHAFRTRTEMNVMEAAAAVRSIPIIHPHGCVGALRQGQIKDGFGSVPASVLPLAQSIRTYSEEGADKIQVNRIRAMCAHADRLIFLGFSYHPANMNLLFDPSAGVPTGDILGTSLGIGTSRYNAAHARIMRTGRAVAPTFQAETCANLIQKHIESFE